MPIPVTSQDADRLKAALLAKGMLADRGRYTPFAGDAGTVANDPNTTGDAASLQSAVAGNAASGGGKSFPSSGAAVTDKTALPISDDALNKMGESDATDLLIALGVTGAAALTAYLARRRAKLNNPGEDVPLVEGETLDSEPKEAKSGIVDGEFTEVADKQIGTTKKIAQGTTVPDNQGMKAIGAPKEVDVPKIAQTRTLPKGASRKTLAQQLAARAGQVQPNDVGPIAAPDALSDLTPDEINQAETLMEQLRRNRTKGNSANVSRIVGDRTVRSTAPTGTVDRESLFNTVVRAIREGKLGGRAVARVVP